MNSSDWITVVAGYPRSGTAMMMQVLEAGGLPALKDDHYRPPSEHNPRGFFECERALRLGARGESTDWLAAAKGRAVKIFAYQLRFLPPEHRYKVIFMRRRAEEILASSRRMGLVRQNVKLSEREQVLAYKTEFVMYEVWLARQPNMQAIDLWYHELLGSPRQHLARVREFLGLPLSIEAMVAAVEPALHRNRALAAGG